MRKYSKNKLSVAFISKSVNPSGGGATGSLHLMADGLARRGHQVSVYALESIDSEGELEYDQEFIDICRENNNIIDYIKKIQNHLQHLSHTYDIIHVFDPDILAACGSVQDDIDSAMVGRLNTYTPFCTNLSVMDGECHRSCTSVKRFKHDTKRLSKKLIRVPRYSTMGGMELRNINRFNRLFAQSPQVRDIYAEFGYDSDNIVVVPNFVDETFTSQSAPQNLAKNHGKLRLLYAGRLTKGKGVRYLIAALQGLDNLNLRIDVLGGGSRIEKLQDLSAKICQGIEIKFHGFVEYQNVGDFYERADVLIHPHTYPEASGRAILEALQYDCAVICSDIGGPRWYAGDACVTVPPRDAGAIRDKLLMLHDDRRRLHDMQNACRNQLKKFSATKVLEQIEQQYEDAITAN